MVGSELLITNGPDSTIGVSKKYKTLTRQLVLSTKQTNITNLQRNFCFVQRVGYKDLWRQISFQLLAQNRRSVEHGSKIVECMYQNNSN